MKYSSVLFFLLFAGIYACSQNKESNKDGGKTISTDIVANPATASGNTTQTVLPAFQFAEETHDFGKIIAGEKVSYSFKFKNIGNANLIISAASGSCGCTVPQWPTEPIGPGKEGVINVIFNSEGKSGVQKKTVTLTSNTIPNTKVLTITGEVLEHPKK